MDEDIFPWHVSMIIILYRWLCGYNDEDDEPKKKMTITPPDDIQNPQEEETSITWLQDYWDIPISFCQGFLEIPCNFEVDTEIPGDWNLCEKIEAVRHLEEMEISNNQTYHLLDDLSFYRIGPTIETGSER